MKISGDFVAHIAEKPAKIDNHGRKERTTVKKSSVKNPKKVNTFIYTYKTTPTERIEIIRAGVSTEEFDRIRIKMGLSKEEMFSLLHLSRSTINRRTRAKAPLSVGDSERIIRLQRLIGQVETLVADFGNTSDFNAAQWLSNWLRQPLAALNNARPADYFDTIEGMDLVSSLLSKIQSGAYA